MPIRNKLNVFKLNKSISEIAVLMDLKNYYIANMSILSNTIYRFNTIPTPPKNNNNIFHRIRVMIPEFVWNQKRPWIVKAILRKKNKAEGIMCSDFKLSYKATVISIVWSRHKNRQIYQWNKIESSEKNTCLYDQLIYDKLGQNIKWEKKRASSINGIEKMNAKEWNGIIFFFTPNTKINSRWIKNINVSP